MFPALGVASQIYLRNAIIIVGARTRLFLNRALSLSESDLQEQRRTVRALQCNDRRPRVSEIFDLPRIGPRWGGLAACNNVAAGPPFAVLFVPPNKGKSPKMIWV